MNLYNTVEVPQSVSKASSSDEASCLGWEGEGDEEGEEGTGPEEDGP